MSYLLDTHVLLWWFDDTSILTEEARVIIENPSNTIYISSVVTWEIIIKQSLGKLKVPSRIYKLIRSDQFQELPITIDHTLALIKLPQYHTDPFDRLLIAQAITENGTILTRDKAIMKYAVKTIKA